MVELGTRRVAVIQAAPFCFGPVSTSLAVVKVLREHDFAIVWLAEGTALELLEAEVGTTGDYVVPFRLSSSADRAAYAHYVEEADVVLVNTDPDFAAFAADLNPTVVYLDILYWMWHAVPPIVDRCVSYLYEDFVRSDEQIARVGLPRHGVRVGPLIGRTVGRADRRPDPTGAARHLLVSVGGLHRPGYASGDLLTAYRDMVVDAVVGALPPGEFGQIYIAGGGIDRSDRKLADGTHVRYGCLSRAEYASVLRTAAAAVLAPGLTGFYEAAAADVPTFYLPPHNYSQHLQLQSYRAVLDDGFHADWDRLGIRCDLACFLPEEDVLVRVDSALRQVVTRGDELRSCLSLFLREGYHQFGAGSGPAMLLALAGASGGGGGTAVDGVSGVDRVVDEVLRHLPTGRGHRRRAAGVRDDLAKVPLPKKLTLELFGGCQLRCPLCPTGNRISPSPAKGPLKVELAESLLAELGGDLETVELFNWGEPFLHPDACRIIRLFADRGIRTVVSSNLQKIPDPRELIDSGLDELIFSCHGMTQQTYEQYMVGGSLARALDNLDRILDAGGPQMALTVRLRFVVFAHNEHELPLAFDRFRGRPVAVEGAPMRLDMREEILRDKRVNLTVHGQWVPDSSRFYDKQAGRARRAPAGCNFPFEEATVDVSGSVTPCCSCYDPQHQLGNVVDAGSFAAVWNGPAYQAARRVVSGVGSTGGEAVICRTCKRNGYRDF